MSNSPDRPAIPSTATELELLRAFEPVVRFTSGELFFPMDVERYVGAGSLWLYHPDDHDVRSPVRIAALARLEKEHGIKVGPPDTAARPPAR